MRVIRVDFGEDEGTGQEPPVSLNRVEEEIACTGKQKTSVMVDQGLWKKWILFVIDKRGSARKLSQELELAMREYMKKHRKVD